MITEDLSAYFNYLQPWIKELLDEDKKTICLLSPNTTQVKVISSFVPLSSKIIEIKKGQWDLNTSSENYFDIIIAMNVFMYSNNPAVWFNNVLKSCKHFFIQDVVNRYRSGSGQLGDDGDNMRYSIGEINSSFYNAYNIVLHHEVIDWIIYNAGINSSGIKASHFLAHIK